MIAKATAEGLTCAMEANGRIALRDVQIAGDIVEALTVDVHASQDVGVGSGQRREKREQTHDRRARDEELLTPRAIRERSDDERHDDPGRAVGSHEQTGRDQAG